LGDGPLAGSILLFTQREPGLGGDVSDAAVDPGTDVLVKRGDRRRRQGQNARQLRAFLRDENPPHFLARFASHRIAVFVGSASPSVEGTVDAGLSRSDPHRLASIVRVAVK